MRLLQFIQTREYEMRKYDCEGILEVLVEFEEYISNTDPLGRHPGVCAWVSPSLAILILFPICLITIFLCTWVAVHPNIFSPRNRASWESALLLTALGIVKNCWNLWILGVDSGLIAVDNIWHCNCEIWWHREVNFQVANPSKHGKRLQQRHIGFRRKYLGWHKRWWVVTTQLANTEPVISDYSHPRQSVALVPNWGKPYPESKFSILFLTLLITTFSLLKTNINYLLINTCPETAPSAVRIRVVRTRYVLAYKIPKSTGNSVRGRMVSWEGTISLRKRVRTISRTLHLLRENDLLYDKFDSFTMPTKEEIKDRWNF